MQLYDQTFSTFKSFLKNLEIYFCWVISVILFFAWQMEPIMIYSYIFNVNIMGEDMANTSLTLGEHWETFIKNEVASGRYTSVSEVVRDALRGLEERKSRLDALRTHLRQGEEQARRGEFVESYSIGNVISELDEEI